MTPRPETSILFVCMGNICRSPLAEGIFLHRAAREGMAGRFRVDSAGTGGWHRGEPADPRMRATAQRHGVTLHSRARQVEPGDFTTFDLLVCMDEDNREELLAMGAPETRLRMLLDFDAATPICEVPDPYYGGQDGFETVFAIVDSACAALLDDLCRLDTP